MYQFYFKQGIEQISIPIAPAELTTKVGNSNKTVQILNIGEVTLLKSIGLREFQFTLLLPGSPFGGLQTKLTWKDPIFYLNKFREYKKSKKPVSLIIFRELADGTQLFDGNIEVSFEDYIVKEKAGEQGDFWVEIRLKEYRKISSTPYKLQNEQGKNVLTVSGMPRENKEVPKTYTVKPGDNLWKISKTVLNDGNKFSEIAKFNGISNPDEIFPGQVLKLEESL